MRTKRRIRQRLLAGMAAFLTLCMVGFQPMQVSAAPSEVAAASLGIDVSRYQGAIDWAQVAASGVQFAIVRVGYRTQATGIMNEDPYARYNLQEAQKNGIKVGAYFFSTAVTPEEAVEEATFTANLIDQYQITYPVAYNCEGFRQTGSRQYALGKDARTALAVAFLDTIAARGYTPMFYASKNEMEGSQDWNMSVLANKYKIWVSWYPSAPFPQTPACTYSGVHSMWQYTQSAPMAGIAGTVDMNVAYFAYDGIAEAKNPSAAIQVTSPSNIVYTNVNEVVIAKSVVNVRTEASTANDSTIVTKLNPGDAVFRTGIDNNGWSRILIGDQPFYVATSYLQKVG